MMKVSDGKTETPNRNQNMSRNLKVGLVKQSVNSLNDEKVQEQLHKLCHKSIGKTYTRFGWTCKIKWELADGSTNQSHTYLATLTYSKAQLRERTQSDKVFDQQGADITRKLQSAARSLGWMMQRPLHNDGQAAVDGPQEVVVAGMPSTPVAKQERSINLPDNVRPWFSHIFDRDSQIRLVYQAIHTAVETQFRHRNHVVLWGQPACGKTEIMSSFVKMLGEENCLRLDAVSTTKAGLENVILEQEEVPPFLIIEELEKVNPVNIGPLLGILDQRAEVIKTNARVGSIRREARCLCLCTVNNMPLFKEAMSGALASRFSHKLYCPRPTREVLRLILSREVKEMGGKEEWIEPVLDYALEEEKTNDPRRVCALLDGRDRLLTGSYQKDLRAVLEAERRDNPEQIG
jgi:hypothetical protein